MSSSDGGDYRVGYGRPPQHTRWKKGQSGNPKGRPKRSSQKDTIQIIDALLEEEFTVIQDGVSRRMTFLEAILNQLWIKEMAGDMGALNVRLALQKLAASLRGPENIIIELVASDYTRKLGEGFRSRGVDDERQ